MTFNFLHFALFRIEEVHCALLDVGNTVEAFVL